MRVRPRNPVRVAAWSATTALDGLLVLVMVRLAQRLQIHRVKEQRHIALVRDDVIDNGCRYDLICCKAVDAQRMSSEMRRTQLLPTPPVQMLPRFRLLSILGKMRGAAGHNGSIHIDTVRVSRRIPSADVPVQDMR